MTCLKLWSQKKYAFILFIFVWFIFEDIKLRQFMKTFLFNCGTLWDPGAHGALYTSNTYI